MHESHLFSHTFRIIVSIFVIHNRLKFDRNFKNTYPPELQLKKKSISTSKESLLDLPVIIKNKMF